MFCESFMFVVPMFIVNGLEGLLIYLSTALKMDGKWTQKSNTT